MSDQAAQRKSTVVEIYLQTVKSRLMVPEAAAPQGFLREVADVVVRGGGAAV